MVDDRQQAELKSKTFVCESASTGEHKIPHQPSPRVPGTSLQLQVQSGSDSLML